jgi:hypothetical protein
MTPLLNPYPGPRPFTAGEASYFYGRDWECRELVSLTFAHRVVFLYAQSGAGKSSFLNAKLVPELKSEGFEACLMGRPGAPVPEGVLRRSSANVYTFNTLAGSDLPPLQQAAKEQDSLAAALASLPPVFDEDGLRSPRLLAFDQFEEIFKSYPEHAPHRRGFFDQLADALKQDKLLHVLLVIREDHLADLESAAVNLPDRPAMRFRLERLRRDAAIEAVESPVERLPRSYGPGVAAELVDRLLKSQEHSQYVEPVQLQVVCQSMWERLPSSVTQITTAHLDQYADVDRTLAGYYDETVRATCNATGISESVLRNWFEHVLITGERTRGTVFAGASGAQGIPPSGLDELEKRHIIRSEFRANARWYELTHDRFVEPILQANAAWREKRPEFEGTRLWLEQRARVRPMVLLETAELQRAAAWLATPEVAESGYDPVIDGLLEASRAELKRRADEQAALHQQARWARSLRLLSAVLALLLLLAVGAVIYANYLRDVATQAQQTATEAEKQARDQKIDADRQREAALEAKAGAERSEASAVLEKNRAETAARIAELERRKAHNSESAAQRSAAVAALNAKDAAAARDRERKAREQAEGVAGQLEVSLAGEKEARQSELRAKNEALALGREAVVQQYTQAALASMDVEPGEGLLHAKQALLTLMVSDRLPPRALDAFREALPGAMIRNTVHADGAIARAGLDPGKGLLLVLENGAVLRSGLAGTLDSAPRSVAPAGTHTDIVGLSPDGRFALQSWMDLNARGDPGFFGHGMIRITPTLPGLGSPVDLQVSRHPLSSMAVSPDGQWLACGSQFGFRFLFDLRQKKRKWRRPQRFYWLSIVVRGSPTRVPQGFAFNSLPHGAGRAPSSSMLAVAVQDGSVELWNLEGQQIAVKKDAHQGPVNAVAFSQDGRYLVSAGRDKAVKLWTVPALEPVQTFTGHTDAVLSAAFSPDNRYFVTGAQDGTARLWRRDGGPEAALVFRGHRGYVSSVCFQQQPNWLITASSEGVARVWNLTHLEKVLDANRRAGTLADRRLPVLTKEMQVELLSLFRLLEGRE